MNSSNHAAHVINFLDVLVRVLLHLIGQCFYVPTATQRIDGAMHTGFMRQDLLRAQRHANGSLGGETKRLIHTVRVQTLAPAKHAGHRLEGNAHNIVERLLLREAATRCLHMRTHQHAAFVLCAKTIAHGVRPNAARGTKFAYFLEEFVVTVKEETQARCERIDRHATLDARFCIFHSVAQRERQFLRGT